MPMKKLAYYRAARELKKLNKWIGKNKHSRRIKRGSFKISDVKDGKNLTFKSRLLYREPYGGVSRKHLDTSGLRVVAPESLYLDDDMFGPVVRKVWKIWKKEI